VGSGSERVLHARRGERREREGCVFGVRGGVSGDGEQWERGSAVVGALVRCVWRCRARPLCVWVADMVNLVVPSLSSPLLSSPLYSSLVSLLLHSTAFRCTCSRQWHASELAVLLGPNVLLSAVGWPAGG